MNSFTHDQISFLEANIDLSFHGGEYHIDVVKTDIKHRLEGNVGAIHGNVISSVYGDVGGVKGDVKFDVEGSVEGRVQGNVGNVCGNVLGDVKGVILKGCKLFGGDKA